MSFDPDENFWTDTPTTPPVYLVLYEKREREEGLTFSDGDLRPVPWGVRDTTDSVRGKDVGCRVSGSV